MLAGPDCTHLFGQFGVTRRAVNNDAVARLVTHGRVISTDDLAYGHETDVPHFDRVGLNWTFGKSGLLYCGARMPIGAGTWQQIQPSARQGMAFEGFSFRFVGWVAPNLVLERHTAIAPLVLDRQVGRRWIVESRKQEWQRSRT